MRTFSRMPAVGVVLAAALSLPHAGPAVGQEPTPTATQQVAGETPTPPAAAPGEHPLAPAIVLAKSGLERIEATIRDYSCTMVKREKVGDELRDHEYMFVKVRHEPFSVYIRFLGPEDLKDQEVVWVEGRNDGNMLAHAGGGVRALMGTVSLKPDSPIAMEGQRYPITEIGMQNLTRKLIEVAEHDSQFGECEVTFFPGGKVNGRVCTCITVVHPVKRENFRYHMARVFIDDELQIPVRFEAYDWPSLEGGEAELLEEYTYMNVKFNNGFTDEDFDVKNPAYRFASGSATKK